MPNIGFPELIGILVIVLLLFGPKKLPDLARSMGQAIREFRRASQDVIEEIHRSAEAPHSEKDPESNRIAAADSQAAQGTDAEKPKESPATKQL